MGWILPSRYLAAQRVAVDDQWLVWVVHGGAAFSPLHIQPWIRLLLKVSLLTQTQLGNIRQLFQTSE
jgi:hypothetical protein